MITGGEIKLTEHRRLVELHQNVINSGHNMSSSFDGFVWDSHVYAQSDFVWTLRLRSDNDRRHPGCWPFDLLDYVEILESLKFCLYLLAHVIRNASVWLTDTLNIFVNVQCNFLIVHFPYTFIQIRI